VIGQLARDRNLLLNLLMYIPPAPVGAAAVVLDILTRGHALRSHFVPRFALAIFGTIAIASGIVPLLGLRPPDRTAADVIPVTLLHWNVQWGGRHRTESAWEETAQRILSRRPDVIVLSEAPPETWLAHSLRRAGGEWHTAEIANDPGSHYWYRLIVCSRRPVHFDSRVPVRNGAAMAVTVDVEGRPLRLLVVDGISTITLSRTPFLSDVAAACETGAGYDVIVGDFNSVGRSVGFDAVRRADGSYRDASEYCGGYRATWPAPLPLYDIDHVLVRAGNSVTHCEIFSSALLESDHRGQFVSLGLARRR